MRHLASLILTVLVVAALSGCQHDSTVAQNGTGGNAASREPQLRLPAGTALEITLETPLTSETATVGSRWTGSIRNSVLVDGRDAIPAGSSVSGTVTAVRPARRGDRAMLDLGLTSVMVGDRRYGLHGGTEAIVAGSTRARNLGAIGAATVVGAVVGHQIGGSDKGTIIGGLLGGAAAAGAVSRTDGYQVELKSGTAITFTTSASVAVRG